MQAVKDLVWKHMLPAFSDSPLPDNNEDAALLSEKLRNLTPRTPVGGSDPPSGSRLWGREFVFPQNGRGLRSVRISPRPSGTLLTFTNGEGSHQIVCGHDTWQAGRTAFEPPSLVNLGVVHDGSATPCAACGGWTSPDVFSALLHRKSDHRGPYLTVRARSGHAQPETESERSALEGETST